MEYTTLDNLKEYLGIVWNDNNTFLEKIIKKTTAQFDKYLWRNLELKSYTEYIPTDYDDILITGVWPITDIITLKTDDVNWELINYTRTDWNIVFLKSSNVGMVYIEYNSGYILSDILDVEQSCLEVCSNLWNSTTMSWNEVNVKNKKIETLSKTYFTPEEMNWWNKIDFRETLDNYKTLTPYIV